MTPQLLANITTLGGEVLSSYEVFKAIQARVPLESLEALAESDDVRWIGPADQAMTNREVSVSKPRTRGSLNDRLAEYSLSCCRRFRQGPVIRYRTLHSLASQL